MRELLSKLWFKVILGMISGIALGLALSPSAFALIPSEAAFKLAPWIALIGNVFSFNKNDCDSLGFKFNYFRNYKCKKCCNS